VFALPVVLTTTGGGAEGPSGALLKGITDAFPYVAPINRMANLKAMDDSRLAEAVKATGRRKLILTGITTDFCLVYPALSLIAAGYHVFIAVDAAGSWTKEINDWALHRLVQAGATPTNVQSIAGELQNSSMNGDPDATKSRMPQLMKWFGAFTPAPAIIAQDGAYKEG